MERVYIQGIGVAAPGMEDWPAARAVLQGQTAYVAEPMTRFRTALLPRNESRRAGAGVHLAFRVAEQACAGHDPAAMAAVFSSSAGDIDLADRLCSSVALPPRALSPTLFHNSVHNAPAGYWSIATGSRAPTTSLSAGAGGFVASLCEAWGMLADSGQPLLLVCHDLAGAGMLAEARRDIGSTFAVAWLLSVDARQALGWIERPMPVGESATGLDIPALEKLRRLNASARCLPLLAALADGAGAPVIESEQGNRRLRVGMT